MGLCIGNFNNSILPNSVKDAIGADVPQYGVKFDGTNSAGIRTYDASSLRWDRSSNTIAGIDDFKNLAPFNVKECVTKYNADTNSREVLAYSTDSNYAEAIPQGDVMIEVPSFWYKRPSRNEFIIAPSYKEGFSPSPWHYRKGVMKDFCRISKYQIGSGYVSKTGVATLANTSMNTIRTNFRAKGWYMLDHTAWYSMLMLMLVKYANMDFQATVSAGRSSGNATISSGGADNVLGLDGSATSVGANEASKTFGIENFYCNAWNYLDGMYGYGGHIYIKDVEDMVNDPTSTTDLSTYTQLSATYPTNGNNSSISQIAFNSDYDYLMYPTAIGTPSPSHDNMWSTSTLDLVIVGGSAWAGGSSGGFSFNVNNAVGSSFASCGCFAQEI